MDDLQGKVEALLFVATKPLSMGVLARLVGEDEAAVQSAVRRLAEERNTGANGIHIVINDGAVQLATNPAYAAVVKELTDVDLDPELTRPSLETLTIVAYRGPMTKPEIEAIRGVNCSLILRNLLLRGLIEEDDGEGLQPVYRLSTDALRFFGVHTVEELPDYSALHANARIDQLLAALTQEQSSGEV